MRHPMIFTRMLVAALWAACTLAVAQPPNVVVAALETAPAGPGTPFTVVVTNTGARQTVSGFAFAVAFDDSQVAFLGASDNTGQPAAGVEYFAGLPIAEPVGPGTNVHVPLLMSTEQALTGAGPLVRLHFMTTAAYGGTIRLALQDLFGMPIYEGLSDGDLNEIPHVFSVPDPLLSEFRLDVLEPSSMGAGSPDFTLTLGGLGFQTASEVLWAGSPRTTSYVSATTLTATILASDVAMPGTALVQVVNAGPVAYSNTLPFTITGMPGVTYVDDDWVGLPNGTSVVFAGAPVNPHVIGHDAFAAIQPAVDAVATNGLVMVAVGTYSGAVTLARPVTVRGPQAGVPIGAAGRNGGEAVCSAPGATAFAVAVSGVTLDGLSVSGSSVGVGLAPGVSATIGCTGLAGCGTGIVASDAALALTDSALTGHTSAALRLEGAAQLDTTTTLFSGSGLGVGIAGAAGARFVLCRITANTTGVQVAAGVDAAAVNLVRNHIWANTGAGAENMGLNTLPATGSWWGEALGPLDPVGNPPGRGNAVSAGVAYDPWYDKGRVLNDRDGDGILNAFEDANLDNVRQSNETGVTVKDSDGDGFEDGVEVRYGSDPLSVASTPPDGFPYNTTGDADGDGYRDFYEYAHHSDPSLAASRPQLGDTNTNGHVSVVDMVLLRRYLEGLVGFYHHDRMDFDRNGDIDVTDSAILRRFASDPLQLLPDQ